MPKKYYYTQEITVKSSVKLTALNSVLNQNQEKAQVVGICISDHATGKTPSGLDKVSAAVASSAYLTLNDFQENVISELPVSVIVKTTELEGYFPLNVGQVDFNNSYLKFSDITAVDGKGFVVTFIYSR